MSREEVYKAIDGERAYQDEKWGGSVHDNNHSVAAWLTYIDYYLHKAKAAVTKSESDENALIELRKVVALGIACFEVHGVPERE